MTRMIQKNRSLPSIFIHFTLFSLIIKNQCIKIISTHLKSGRAHATISSVMPIEPAKAIIIRLWIKASKFLNELKSNGTYESRSLW